MLFLRVHREVVRGAKVLLDCPWCDNGLVKGTAVEHCETTRLLLIIDISETTTTFVVCDACKLRMRSQLGLDELKEHAGKDVTRFLTCEAPFITKALAILSLLFSWAPFVNIALPLITLCAARRYRGWPKSLAILSLLLGIAFTIFGLVMIVLNEPG